MARFDWISARAAVHAWLTSAVRLEDWATSTSYKATQRRTNGGNVYEVVIAGTSAASGPGPAGTGSAISDGSVVWKYVAAGTGVPVIWEGQGAPQPADDYVGLSLAERGGYHFPTEQVLYDGTRPAGQEIELRVSQEKGYSLTVRAYTLTDRGDHSATAVLGHAELRMRLPTQRDLLKADGKLAVLEIGTTLQVPTVAGSNFQQRAALEVLLLGVDSASELTGYIAQAQLVSNVN